MATGLALVDDPHSEVVAPLRLDHIGMAGLGIWIAQCRHLEPGQIAAFQPPHADCGPGRCAPSQGPQRGGGCGCIERALTGAAPHRGITSGGTEKNPNLTVLWSRQYFASFPNKR